MPRQQWRARTRTISSISSAQMTRQSAMSSRPTPRKAMYEMDAVRPTAASHTNVTGSTKRLHTETNVGVAYARAPYKQPIAMAIMSSTIR